MNGNSNTYSGIPNKTARKYCLQIATGFIIQQLQRGEQVQEARKAASELIPIIKNQTPEHIVDQLNSWLRDQGISIADDWSEVFLKMFNVYAHVFGHKKVKNSIGLEFKNQNWRKALETLDLLSTNDLTTYYLDWLRERFYLPLTKYDPGQAPFGFWLRESICFVLLNARKKVLVENKRLLSQQSTDEDLFPEESIIDTSSFSGIEIIDLASSILDSEEFAIFYAYHISRMSQIVLAERHQVPREEMNEWIKQVTIKVGYSTVLRAMELVQEDELFDFLRCNERSIRHVPYVVVDVDVITEGEVQLIVAGGVEAAEGRWHVLGVYRVQKLTCDAWIEIFNTLFEKRGLHGVRLMIAFDYPGFEAAFGSLPEGVSWQMCQQRFAHNVWKEVPKNYRGRTKQGLEKSFKAPNEETRRTVIEDLYTQLENSNPDGLTGLLQNQQKYLSLFAVHAFDKSIRNTIRTTWTTHALSRRPINLQNPYQESYADFLTKKIREVNIVTATGLITEVEAWAQGFQMVSALSKKKYLDTSKLSAHY